MALQCESSNSEYLTYDGAPRTAWPIVLTALVKTSTVPSGIGPYVILATGWDIHDYHYVCIGTGNTQGECRMVAFDRAHGSISARSASDYSDGNWHRVTARFDYDGSTSSEAQLWIDTEGPVTDTDTSASAIGNFDSVSIGALHMNSVGRHIDAEIQDAAIYGSMTQAEAETLHDFLYNSGTHKLTSDGSAPQTPVAAWPLDGDYDRDVQAADTELDDTIASADMTIGTAPYWSTDVVSAATTPTVTTTDPATSITANTASVGGNVTADGGATVTERGVVWAYSTGPTTSDNKVTSGSGTGSFSASLTSMLGGTKIFARAYATNSEGTAYGSEITFDTLRGGTADLGATGIMYTGSNPGFALDDASWEMTCAFYLNASPATSRRLLSVKDAALSNNDNFQLRFDGNDFLEFVASNSTSQGNLVKSVAACELNKWYRVTVKVTYSGSNQTLTLWLNNDAEQTDSITDRTTPNAGVGYFMVGGYELNDPPGGTGGSLDAKITDVATASGGFSKTDHDWLFNNGSNRTVRMDGFTGTAAANWPLNQSASDNISGSDPELDDFIGSADLSIADPNSDIFWAAGGLENTIVGRLVSGSFTGGFQFLRGGF